MRERPRTPLSPAGHRTESPRHPAPTAARTPLGPDPRPQPLPPPAPRQRGLPPPLPSSSTKAKAAAGRLDGPSSPRGAYPGPPLGPAEVRRPPLRSCSSPPRSPRRRGAADPGARRPPGRRRGEERRREASGAAQTPHPPARPPARPPPPLPSHAPSGSRGRRARTWSQRRPMRAQQGLGSSSRSLMARPAGRQLPCVCLGRPARLRPARMAPP